MAREKSEKFAEILAAEEKPSPKKENAFVKAGQNLKGAKDNQNKSAQKDTGKPKEKPREKKDLFPDDPEHNILGDKKERKSALKGVLKEAKKKNQKKSQSYYLKISNIEKLEKYGKSRNASASEVLDALLDEIF